MVKRRVSARMGWLMSNIVNLDVPLSPAEQENIIVQLVMHERTQGRDPALTDFRILEARWGEQEFPDVLVRYDRGDGRFVGWCNYGEHFADIQWEAAGAMEACGG